MYRPLRSWPTVLRYPEAIEQLRPAPYIGLDVEWSVRTGVPNILGLSDGTTTVSVSYQDGREGLRRLLARCPDARWAGHNLIQADMPVLAADGIEIPVEQVDDTILYHYLTNSSLCKSNRKVEDDEAEKRGRGFMNLYCFVSLYTDLPNWKQCWGDGCEESSRPCPQHSPFLYNGVDTVSAVWAMPGVLQRAKLLGVDKLYPLHRDVSVVLAKMRDRGVLIDVPYVDKLRSDFVSEASRIAAMLPFNPDSPPQLTRYFRENKLPLNNAQEQTLRDAVEDLGLEEADEDSPEFTTLDTPKQHLVLTLLRKELGKGPDRWFAPRSYDYDKGEWDGYVDDDGFVHPNFNFFTSTGRLACSGPNLQNVAIRRKDRNGESLGKQIRRACIAPDGYYWYKADYSSAEYRAFLVQAGYTDIPNEDFHTWMARLVGFKEEDTICRALGGPRQAAKSVVFSSLYFEGIKLVTPSELRSSRIQREISAGARLVFPDWKVWDTIVTFTGINLAKRALGGASWENRRRALEIAEKFFARFPKTRGLQRVITKQAEQERCVRPPTGYVLSSYGFPEERLKTAMAMYG